MKKLSKVLLFVLAAVVLSGAAAPGGLSDSPSPEREHAAEPAVCVSGFVYEAVRSNRIEGATATLYGENEAGEPVLWDAGDSGQENPQTTDGSGAFRWDVPEGKWRVEIAKEHYEKAYADWQDGDPGRESAVPLVSLTAPKVVGVVKKRDNYLQKDYITLTFSQYMDRDTIDEDTIVLTKDGEPVDCEISAADREVSGESEYVYYARTFDLYPEKGATELTVTNVKSYAGLKLKGTFRIPTEEIAPAVVFTFGDVDGNGKITPADARLALRASVGLFAGESDAIAFGEGSRMFLAADCDCSGKIEAGDARTILRASVGLELKESNSGLVTYTNLTEKHDVRTHRIDKITIHHMSDQATAQQCCDYFCETDREVSVNYIIGCDGSIALNVEEKYRAWTSGSEANDMRAVTIEVSNDGGDPDWHVSDISMEKLIDLCTDICRRNGIGELVCTGDAYGNLTMHKMFADTDCPGPYLSGKLDDIAAEVNKRLAAPPVQ